MATLLIIDRVCLLSHYGDGQKFMWEPLSENKLMEMIEEAELFMSPGCRKFWDYIKITPQKWSLSPWGDEGGGFWVVAVIGKNCIYYNDIEEGFNFSPYTSFGQIDRYCCSQPDLLPTISGFHQVFLREIQDGTQLDLGKDLT